MRILSKKLRLKNKIFLIVLLTIAVFIRFYKLNKLMYFIGDFGWYYLSARDFLLSGDIPLIGIPSSVPVLRQGAIFTWLLAGVLWLFRFNPLAGAYLTTFLGVIAVITTYKLISEWFGKRAGILASLFVATSPFVVEIDRAPFVVGPMFLLTLLIAWSFTLVLNKDQRHFFLLGLWLAILYQFELAGFILLPIILVSVLVSKIKIRRKDLFKFILGGVFGLMPFIIHDLGEGVYLQTLGFLGWLGTKVIEGFWGIFSGSRNAFVFQPLLVFFKRFIYPGSSSFAFVIFVFSFIYFIYHFSQVKKDSPIMRLVFVWFMAVIIGFFLRGVYSEAYMPLIYLPLVVITTLFLEFLILRFKRVGWIIFFILIGGNTVFLLTNDFLSEKREYVRFSQKVEVASFIIQDAKNENYELDYIGPGDEFHSGDNHWRYLLWWLGNESKDNAQKTYALIEGSFFKANQFAIIKDYGNIKVGVKK